MQALSPRDLTRGLELAARVDARFRPVWQGRSDRDKAALALYFLPHRSKKPVLGPTRPRLVKWYCPFADQRDFPSGHRYCLNVYAGCDHGCVYCYAAGYSSAKAAVKKRFYRLLERDLDELEAYGLPPAPIHLSNSTDPFQPLEVEHGHTHHALAELLKARERFTTVTLLTRNPSLAAQPASLRLLDALGGLPRSHPRHEELRERDVPGLTVEVSLAFWRDEERARWDPDAPSVAERRRGIRALREADVPVVLRIDPLFPRANGREPQSLDDLDKLVGFARAVGARHVVYSAAKLVKPRGRATPRPVGELLSLYRELAAPDRLVFRGGSWRLSETTQRETVIAPFMEICDSHGVTARLCKDNLLETP